MAKVLADSRASARETVVATDHIGIPTREIGSEPKLFRYPAYACDPARRAVTVERTAGKVMAVLTS